MRYVLTSVQKREKYDMRLKLVSFHSMRFIHSVLRLPSFTGGPDTLGWHEITKSRNFRAISARRAEEGVSTLHIRNSTTCPASRPKLRQNEL